MTPQKQYRTYEDIIIIGVGLVLLVDNYYVGTLRLTAVVF